MTTALMVGDFEYQDVMILDYPAVGTCLWRARRIIPTSCLLNRDLSSTFYRWRRLKA
jgi:hypothetical protein